MKKPKSHNFIVPLVVYPFDFMFSIAQTDKQFLDSVSEFFDLEDYKEQLECMVGWNETVRGRFLLLSCNRTIIRMKEPPRTPESKGVLQHEIFHAVFNILKKMGFKASRDSEEAYAYLIGYITEQVYKNLHCK